MRAPEPGRTLMKTEQVKMQEENKHIRVALVDDHSLCRRGLTELLTQRYGIQVVGATDNIAELEGVLREHKPDLLVMDLRMEPLDGLQIIERLRKDGDETPVVMLTMSDAGPLQISYDPLSRGGSGS